MAEKWDYAVELDIKSAELTSLYWRSMHEMAEATLAVLEHDTEQTRGRAWHLAHKLLGHDWWCGVEINPDQYDGSIS